MLHQVGTSRHYFLMSEPQTAVNLSAYPCL